MNGGGVWGKQGEGCSRLGGRDKERQKVRGKKRWGGGGGTEERERGERERGGSPLSLNSWDLSGKLIAHQCPAELPPRNRGRARLRKTGDEEGVSE